MKIASYSDIHLEIAKELLAPDDLDADLMILSGDIINFRDPTPLKKFLHRWNKPVLFVAGNHEYYTERPMDTDRALFRAWLAAEIPFVTLLDDEAVSINGVHFFGGTMWTDFDDGKQDAMAKAQSVMPDFKYIRTPENTVFTPADSIILHQNFCAKLTAWLEAPLQGARIIITHHAPLLHPESIHQGSALTPAFNSLDMLAVIEKHQPDYWFYGHTHECDRQKIGRTQIVSNQLGYEGRSGYFECQDSFDPAGAVIEA